MGDDCKHCDGSGKIFNEALGVGIDCEHCDGSGKEISENPFDGTVF